MRALLVGRYQPFHKGHLEVLREALSVCDELVVGIGSAQESHTAENPFTAGERVEMIRLCLTPDERARTIVIPIPDINRYAIWVSHVESLVPSFETVFTNNPLTGSLFKERGYEVRPTRIYDRGVFSGTEIRRRMLSGEPWEEIVPEEIVDYLRSLGVSDRISAAMDERR